MRGYVGFQLKQSTRGNCKTTAQAPKRRKRGRRAKAKQVTTLSLSDEAIAPRREGGWDESFAITSLIILRQQTFFYTTSMV